MQRNLIVTSLVAILVVGDGAIMYGFSRFENADVGALTPVRKQRIDKLRSVRLHMAVAGRHGVILT